MIGLGKKYIDNKLVDDTVLFHDFFFKTFHFALILIFHLKHGQIWFSQCNEACQTLSEWLPIALDFLYMHWQYIKL